MNNIVKADLFSPLFTTTNNQLGIAAGTIYAGHYLPENVPLPEKLWPGSDYAVGINDGNAIVEKIDRAPGIAFIGGFHVGLDGQIVPQSVWDCKFRPKARDPRGMVLVGDFWVDIYLLNCHPAKHGTSSAGVDLATGTMSVVMPDSTHQPLTWWNAVAVLAAHGKQLMSMAEFSVATMGVTEGKAADDKPTKTGHISGLKSYNGLEQATGCMWTWGRDFDPSGGWAVVMGGVWVSAAAGPRRFSHSLPAGDYLYVGARGRCDHLILA